MTDSIKWNASRNGFTTSLCGRFEIVPGTVTRGGVLIPRKSAVAFQITDHTAKRSWTGTTQRGLKAAAQDVVNNEARTPRQPGGKKKSQVQLIFDWLNEHGKLTRWTAFIELGVAELSSRIIALERNGPDGVSQWVVPRITVEVITRNGSRVKVTEYHTPIRASGPPASVTPAGKVVT